MTSLKNTKKSKKKSLVKCKICDADTEIIYDGENIKYPVFICNNHGIQYNEWKKWLEEYSERWKDKIYWTNPRDRLACVIGYFCHKYNEFYGHPYTFDISNPIPYKTKDFLVGRRILNMFNNDVSDVLIYIKWIFAKKIVTRKRSITSLGFFSMTNLVNEYKCAKALSETLKRQTRLPNDFLEWCMTTHPEVCEKHNLTTWNDLNSLISFINAFGMNNTEGNIVKEAINRNLIDNENGKPTFKILGD